MLLFSGQSQGFAKIIQVFVPTGGNLSLYVTEDIPRDFESLSWLFKSGKVLVTYFSSAKAVKKDNRVMVSDNMSLRIQNVQKSDSGNYSARVTGDKSDKSPQYNITVQDPVSSTVSIFNISSSNHCSVTCRTEDFNISSTFRYDNKTCHQEGGERTGVTNAGSFLSIYLSDSSIICNHSNQVSWTQRNLTVQSCFRPEGSTDQNVAVLVLVLVLVLFLVVGLCILLKKWHSSAQSRNYQCAPRPQTKVLFSGSSSTCSPSQSLLLQPPLDDGGLHFISKNQLGHLMEQSNSSCYYDLGPCVRDDNEDEQVN
ncbi:hypothetical protein ILYODFUR_026480 [Ilyodon furcidens]|uniref:Ig-like domain-containing protein n=1 Tax=Ilyodon furcidens TaxID=33524 RepID=A0ABV0UKM8_9TELE